MQSTSRAPRWGACLITLAIAVLAASDGAEPRHLDPGVSGAGTHETAEKQLPRSAQEQRASGMGGDQKPSLAALSELGVSAEAVLETVLSEPSLPGDPQLEARRGVLLARAKGEPVFFVRTPTFGTDASKAVEVYRARLATTKYPWDVLQRLLSIFRSRPEIGRQVLLREGYLYAAEPELAFALVSLVEPGHLFNEDQIWVQRGDRLMRATRKAGHYVYVDGPLLGHPVKLLLFDRLGIGVEPTAPALHRDLRSLAYRLGFDRARVRHFNEQHMLVELRYLGAHWVPTLLRSDGPRLELEQELPDPQLAEQASSLRARGLQRVAAIQALRLAMLEQIDEKLPFDEPRNEVGQEDGKLRRSFRFVYGQGRTSYSVRQEHYAVFDQHGRPLAPQVCIDFLLDTFERASGGWWAPRGEAPRLIPGRLDFEAYVPRDQLRRAQTFIDFAKERSELFHVVELAPSERIEQGRKAHFFRFLAAQADLFQAGDIALIRGKTPWDERYEHYHSFFIYETDPISGVPIAIAGNASTPAIWSWESEARRTPQRTLRYRIRPTEWLLRQVAGPSPRLAPAPPPLVSEFRPAA